MQKWWSRIVFVLVLSFLGLAGTGCVSVKEPFTGRNRIIMTSVEEENQMGAEAWGQILAEEKLSSNQEMITSLNRVGAVIAEQANNPSFQWEFKVLASPEANAFCLPGGKVAVYEGLFKVMKNEAELATIVGHEVGHALARHSGERMTQGLGVNLGAAGLDAALGSKYGASKDLYMQAYMGVASVGVLLPFSREQEYAADEIGVKLMAQGGYNPQAAVDFWKRFAQGKSQSMLDHYLSTHPIDQKRIERLQNVVLPEAIPAYDRAESDRGFGQTYSWGGK